jgi:diaminohydroxyphosphoribosylaminopyrimidine deaminase/5-amino-6-(5-phosphoribosylamino)uracil reductase
MVAAVVVDRQGREVSRGIHRKAGEPHAEAIALARAGRRAQGATLYLNLEPCKHKKNRRTEPCAPKVEAAGIARLVYGMRDPIRSHGGGAAWLRAAGVQVEGPVLEKECQELNRAFVTWARKKRPLFVLKAAMTLDGKISTAAGESKWITGAAARKHGRALRNRMDGILVGSGTVLADDPRLTARGRGTRDPVRIVLDRRLRASPDASFLPANSSSRARVIVATTRSGGARARALREAGAELLVLEADEPEEQLHELARGLAEAGLCSVLVEGGAAVHASFVRAGLCDELRLYVAPMALGQGRAPAWLGELGIAALAGAPRFQFVGDPEPLGPDIHLRLRPK